MAYAFEKFDKKTMAIARANNVSASLKKSVELNNVIRGRKASTIVKYLEAVIDKKAVVPFRKYRAEVAHKKGKGIDTGGYPVNVAKETLKLLKSAMKNANEKDLGEPLYILSVSSRQGVARHHYGRTAGTRMKNMNMEIILAVKQDSKKKAPVSNTNANVVSEK